MAPSDKDSVTGNSTLFGDHDQQAAPTNTQDQALLKALQDLIIRVMDPMQKNNMDEIHLGPEAGGLITALQEFISSIVVRSQSGTQNAIEVSFAEEGDKLQGIESHQSEDGKVGPVPNISASVVGGDANSNNNPEHLGTVEKPAPTFEGALLKALREHVFNMMPTRLLCFEPYESNFQITLLDRSAIYTRIESALRGKFSEGELRSRLVQETEQMIEWLIPEFGRYAILSHTWLRTTPGEVTYGDWNKGRLDTTNPGYQKLVNFCRTAWKDHRLAFGWMDTICINKESSSELDESIRSMYNWYSRAAVCIAYLAETATLANMHLDSWFTRGWTLQELVAPEFIKFYNSDWKELVDYSRNDKQVTEIAKQIERATTMSEHELENVRNTSVSRRMQLAATREVTREEDTAYALMGIFNVSISTAYGEGAARAFSRLLQAILISREDVMDILNWAGELPDVLPHSSRILPTSPKHYINRSTNRNLVFVEPIEPLILVHLGLRVPVLLMPGISTRNPASGDDNYRGEFGATLDVSPVSQGLYYLGNTYKLLDNRVAGSDGWKRNWFQMTFAVYNFTRSLNVIHIPKTCIAISLCCSEEVGKVSGQRFFSVMETNKPIVFELRRKTISYERHTYYNPWFWLVEEGKLANHGMQLINLYL